MVYVVVPLLLKRNTGVFLESSEIHAVVPTFFFCACYGSAIILWVLYVYIYIYILLLYFCTSQIY
jgi:hypothetical protein